MSKQVYQLGQKVKTQPNKSGSVVSGGVTGKGTIYNIGYLNGAIGNTIVVGVMHEGGNFYSYVIDSLSEIKTQKLYSYLDADGEVHWATKQYTDSQMKSFGYKREAAYDKEIDLE